MRFTRINVARVCILTLSAFAALPAALAQTPSTVADLRFTATSENVSGAGEAIKINLTGWSTDAQRDDLVNAWTMKPTAAPAAAAESRGGRGGRGGGGRGGRGARGAAAAPAADGPADPDAVDADNPAFRFGRGGARGRADQPATTPQDAVVAALKKSPTVGMLWTSETVGYSIKYAYRMPQPDGSERIVLATERRVGTWSSLWKPSGAITPWDTGFSIIELHINGKGEGEGKGVLAGKIGVDSQAKTLALDDYATLPVILKGVKRRAGN
jgi:hypothetical protein